MQLARGPLVQNSTCFSFRLRLHTEDCGLREIKFKIQLAKPVDHTMFQDAKITSIIGQESETSLAIDGEFDFNLDCPRRQGRLRNAIG